MITRDGDGFVCTCDDCGDVEAIDGADLPAVGRWQAMIQELKAMQWRIVKKRDGWAHFCPVCDDAWRDERNAGGQHDR